METFQSPFVFVPNLLYSIWSCHGIPLSRTFLGCFSELCFMHNWCWFPTDFPSGKQKIIHLFLQVPNYKYAPAGLPVAPKKWSKNCQVCHEILSSNPYKQIPVPCRKFSTREPKNLTVSPKLRVDKVKRVDTDLSEICLVKFDAFLHNFQNWWIFQIKVDLW